MAIFAFFRAVEERDFLNSYFRGGLAGGFWASVFGALSYVVFFGIAVSSESYSEIALIVRFSVIVLLASVAYTFLKYPEFVLRYYEIFVGGVSCTALMATVFLLSLGPNGHPTDGVGSSPAMIFGLFIHYAFLRLSVSVAFLVGGLVSIVYCFWGVPLVVGGSEVLRSIAYLVLANAVGLVACRTNVSRERNLYSEGLRAAHAESMASSRATAAEEANLKKGLLLAAIGHDIKTPLFSARRSLESAWLFLQREQTASAEEMISSATESVAMVQITLDHIVAMERFGFAGACLPIADVNLNSLLRRLFSNLSHDAIALDVTLEIDEFEGEVIVYSDEAAIWQILINIIRNGLKFTSIRIGENRFVRVKVDFRGGFIRIRIFDSGVGISSFHRKHVWEPYYRVADVARQTSDGVGLGLHLARRAVDALEGHSIRLNSKIGFGSIFTLKMPGRVKSRFDAIDARSGLVWGVCPSDLILGSYVIVIELVPRSADAIFDLLEELGCLYKKVSCDDNILMVLREDDRLVDLVLICSSVAISKELISDYSKCLNDLHVEFLFVDIDLQGCKCDSEAVGIICNSIVGDYVGFDPSSVVKSICSAARRNRAAEDLA